MHTIYKITLYFSVIQCHIDLLNKISNPVHKACAPASALASRGTTKIPTYSTLISFSKLHKTPFLNSVTYTLASRHLTITPNTTIPYNSQHFPRKLQLINSYTNQAN